MDPMLEFVGRQNIDLFITRLELERDSKLRASLRRLLIAEEDKFGQLSERMEIVEQYIRRAGTRIIEQKQRMDKMQRDGVDMSLAEQTLANLEEVHQLLLAGRKTIRDMLNQQRF